MPLIKEYGLHFLTQKRMNLFALLNHILDNNLVPLASCFPPQGGRLRGEDVSFTPPKLEYSVPDLLDLDFFPN